MGGVCVEARVPNSGYFDSRSAHRQLEVLEALIRGVAVHCGIAEARVRDEPE